MPFGHDVVNCVCVYVCFCEEKKPEKKTDGNFLGCPIMLRYNFRIEFIPIEIARQ